MFKVYRTTLAAIVVAAGLAACRPDEMIDNSNTTTIVVHGDTTIINKGGTIDTIIRVDTTHTTPPPAGTVDSIKMTLASYHGSRGDILTPTVQVFTTGIISNDFDCTSDNAGDVTATTAVMGDGKHCKFTLIATTPLNGVGGVQVCAETLEAHTFPDKTQDRLRACAEIYVKP